MSELGQALNEAQTKIGELENKLAEAEAKAQAPIFADLTKDLSESLKKAINIQASSLNTQYSFDSNFRDKMQTSLYTFAGPSKFGLNYKDGKWVTRHEPEDKSMLPPGDNDDEDSDEKPEDPNLD